MNENCLLSLQQKKTIMKKNLLLIVLFFLAFAVNAQYVNLEYFPGELQPTLQYAPTKEAVKIVVKDSLEIQSFYDSLSTAYLSYRIRGYLVPQQDGYYKFYLRVRYASFYLSPDSLEHHKMLAITSSDPWASWTSWPTNLSQRYNPNTTYYIDSILLYHDQPYYFEINSESPSLIGNPWYYNFIGLKWVLPGGDQLQSIKYTDLRPASPKQVRIYCDIFQNQSGYDFEALRTKPFANQKLQLHELSADNIPVGLDNFSSRVRGYIIPPYDGNYSFYFACDDAGQFWLSTDTLVANAQLKSSINSAQTDWTQNVSSQALLADHKYYCEILHHDSTGNSMFKLGWIIPGDTMPGIIDYYSMISYIDSISVSVVRLNEHKKNIQKNQSFILLSEVYPWNTINKDVKWKSTNNSVATVNNNGLVNTLSWGDCQIIVQCVADTTVADTLFLNVNKIEWELFKNRMTYDFDSIRNSSEVPDEVIEIVELNTTNYLSKLDQFASRIRGYLVPPISGEYSFYFAADNTGQFWLSSDTSQANAVLKSEILSIQSDWSQNVFTQTLIGDHKYFFELLHYDTVYTDKVKLGWMMPGDTVPVVIQTPYMIGSGENVLVNSFSILDHEILSYSNWTITPRYHITPWNATNKSILWQSSNNAIATVNANGTITTLSPGSCLIIAQMATDPTFSDTLYLTVTDYEGPYFVKQNVPLDGDGHSWDNAISLTKLLDLLNQGSLSQQTSVYVAEGTYKPTTNFDRNKSFIFNNIRIVGGFSASSSGTDTTNRDFLNHETILSGEIAIPDNTFDNTYNVVVIRGSLTVIDGVTIRDGRANSLMYGDGNAYGSNENNGGGILLQSENAFIVNCKILNNSAWNAGGGLFCGNHSPVPGIPLYGKNLTVQNCQIKGNLIQQTIPFNPGGFVVIANAYGAGFSMNDGTYNLKNCIFSDNLTSHGNGKALAVRSSLINIDNCSFFNNSGIYHDLWVEQTTLNLNNSTIIGSINPMFNSTSNIKNSTIIGGGYIAFDGNTIIFDNSIWTDPKLSFYEGTTNNSWQAKYSILGDSLFGVHKDSIISTTIPNHTSWLDTLAYNGGSTPTAKLKNIPNNPAKSNGNPLYLGTKDQRGALRIDSVSIGAYQYDYPNTGIIEAKVYPEGLLNAATGTLNKSRNATGEQFAGAIADKMILELHETTYPFNLIGTAMQVNLLTTGYAHGMATTPLPDSFYIAVKHRNSLETWSSTPVSPVNGLVQYDFTQHINSAFGNNLKPIGNHFGMYCGDINQDGVINELDMNLLESHSANFGTGYLPEDLNGDGIIDALDLILLDNNAAAFVRWLHPGQSVR